MTMTQEPENFNYQLLARLKQDCDYYLGAGNRAKKHLWAGEEADQIAKMKELYEGFKDKPEWITLEDISRYEAAMVHTDHVVRYVVTHLNEDGMRTLCRPMQGRFTYATPDEAEQMRAAMLANNRMEGNRLAGAYGLPLEVRPVKCYPGHFDPMSCWFDDDAQVEASPAEQPGG